jgi:flagellar biosynthesis/type III secretory pathway protein FliH
MNWSTDMDTILTQARAPIDIATVPVPGGVLFIEDFDLPARAPFASRNDPADPEMIAPEVIAPVFDEAELEAARAASWDDGHAAGRAAQAAEDAVGLRHAVTTLSAEFGAARETAALIAERAAEEIARLLLAALASVFPTLCASHGAAEAAAVVRAVLPALTEEPEIGLRANPRTAPALLAEIERIDPDLARRVRLTSTDALASGDVRIAWRDGIAVRDAAALWRQVAAVLIPAGLLNEQSVTGAGNNGE